MGALEKCISNVTKSSMQLRTFTYINLKLTKKAGHRGAIHVSFFIDRKSNVELFSYIYIQGRSKWEGTEKWGSSPMSQKLRGRPNYVIISYVSSFLLKKKHKYILEFFSFFLTHIYASKIARGFNLSTQKYSTKVVENILCCCVYFFHICLQIHFAKI